MYKDFHILEKSIEKKHYLDCEDRAFLFDILSKGYELAYRVCLPDEDGWYDKFYEPYRDKLIESLDILESLDQQITKREADIVQDGLEAARSLISAEHNSMDRMCKSVMNAIDFYE